MSAAADTSLDVLTELRSSVRSFLTRYAPSAATGAGPGAHGDPPDGLWRAAVDQLRIPAMIIPEHCGGDGFGTVEVGVVFEELGRALTRGPFFSTIAMAATALLTTGDGASRSEYLPQIAVGRTATLALLESNGRWDLEATSTVATRNRGRLELSGTKSYVLDGESSDIILVSARHESKLILVAIDGGKPAIRPVAALDQTRPFAEITFDATPCRLIDADWAAGNEATVNRAITLQACEQVGGAERVLEMAVSYAADRAQFGRPIGSFQAIQHKCADMLVAVEGARSAARAACLAADRGDPDFAVLARIAKVVCSDAYTHCAAANIQIHGGIGFTWEHDAHRYFKRAKSSEMMFGSPPEHRGVIARHIGMSSPP